MQIGETDELIAQLVTELVSSDVATSARFYESLGFDVVRQTQTFSVLRWGSEYVFLSAGSPATGGELPNIRVIVPDVDETYRRVVDRALVTDGSPETQRYGLRDFTVFDPDGYGIRFAEIV